MKTLSIVGVLCVLSPFSVAAQPWADSALTSASSLARSARTDIQAGVVSAIVNIGELYLGQGNDNHIHMSRDLARSMYAPDYYRDIANLTAYGLRMMRGRPLSTADWEEMRFAADQLLEWTNSNSLLFSDEASKETWTKAIKEIVLFTTAKR